MWYIRESMQQRWFAGPDCGRETQAAIYTVDFRDPVRKLNSVQRHSLGLVRAMRYDAMDGGSEGILGVAEESQDVRRPQVWLRVWWGQGDDG